MACTAQAGTGLNSLCLANGAESPHFYQALLDGVRDGVYFVDRDRNILFWNAGAEAISGFNREQVLGRSCRDNILVHCDEKGEQLCFERCPLLATMADGEGRDADVFLRHREGYRVPVRIKSAAVRDETGAIIGAVEIFTDNTPTVAALELARESEQAALLDSLTEVANRRSGDRRLASLAISPEGSRGTVFLFIDIDHFKHVNDTFGHAAGDRVLRTVAATLRRNIRPIDFICRWGGEEFLVVLSNVGREQGYAIAERCRALVERSSCEIQDGVRMQVTCSIGLTEIRRGDSIEAAVARADSFMYAAKSAGRNRVCSEPAGSPVSPRDGCATLDR